MEYVGLEGGRWQLGNVIDSGGFAKVARPFRLRASPPSSSSFRSIQALNGRCCWRRSPARRT